MKFTVMPYLLAMMIAIASAPTDIYQVCAFQIGTLKLEPWHRKRIETIARPIASVLTQIKTYFRASGGLSGLPAQACLIGGVALALHFGQPDAQGVFLMGLTGLKAYRQRDAELKGEIATATKAKSAIGEKAVAEKRAMNDEERAAFLAFTPKIDGLQAQLEDNTQLLAAAEAANEADRNYQGLPVNHETQNSDEAASAEAAAKAGLSKDKKAEVNAFGKFLQHVRAAAMPGGRIDVSLIQAGPTGLNETVPSEGGFLVQQDRVSTIRERVYETGQLISRVNRIPIGAGSNGVILPAINETSRADGSRFGGIRSYWTAEGGEKLASKPSFRLLDLKLKKLAALVYATDELLQDSVALEAWIMNHLPDELMFKVEDSIISGTGAGQPLGILNSGATISVTRNTAGAIKYEDIIGMWSRFYAPSRKTGVWLVEQGAEAQLFSMSLSIGVGGVPVFMPAGGIADAPHPTLFGRPIISSEYGAALGTVGDIMLIDPSQYTLIDKGGVKSDVSMHVRFIYDESVFRFVFRVDGAPEWNSALTPKSGGSTTSPYVLLAT